MKPRSAYVHIPFCAHRCGYCNFTVVAGRDDLADRMVAAIGRELSWTQSPAEVETLYFGGGTPTQLSKRQFESLCAHVKAWHPLAPGGEWTVEANPEHLSRSRLSALAALGVRRISLGGQSFLPNKLQLLERGHQARHIEEAVAAAQELGMQTAVDLVFAVPGESLDDWRYDLARLIELAPDHASTYGLTFERGTAFWSRRRRGNLWEVDEELQRAMYVEGIERLAAAGYEHYEISNFARAGCKSRHNETYWDGGEYYAAGPGAARYVAGVRSTNHRSATKYLQLVERHVSPVAESESLTPEMRARERLVFGLRKMAGIHEPDFATSTGYETDALAGDAIRRFVDAGLLERRDDRLRLTRDGLLVSDALWPELL